eukprot:TRINITY_DN29349_c0_g1_i1.p1 TRINITY_DN29349_c0_g1~~TRINITY_DN29349_c0_g1_i1.p1  ORF type:complete len:179 (-),score=0.54 TRINITY_DN29349_c0_g1_i1:70-606(-)
MLLSYLVRRQALLTKTYTVKNAALARCLSWHRCSVETDRQGLVSRNIIVNNLATVRNESNKPANEEVIVKAFMERRHQKRNTAAERQSQEDAKNPMIYLDNAIKGLFYGIVFTILACIAWGAYDPSYRKSTKTTFPFIYWVLSFYFGDDTPTTYEEDVVAVKAREFKSSFLEEKEEDP